MKKTVATFKLFSDATRLRTLMLLSRQELCVCQIMGVLGVSQPLVSRNIAMLSDAGLLEERRDGKLMFYRVRKKLPEPAAKIVSIIRQSLRDDPSINIDLESLQDCHEFQKQTGKCDMKTFLEFMEKQKKKRKQP